MAEATYTRTYRDFRGVDFSSKRSECDPSRFNYLINMWRDYHSEQGAAVETSPGFRRIAGHFFAGTLFGTHGDGRVNGLHYVPGKDDGTDILVVHAGKELIVHDHVVENGKLKESIVGLGRIIAGDVADAPSRSIIHRDAVYVADGKEFFCLKSPNEALSYKTDLTEVFRRATDHAYVPTTYLNGQPYEQRNMLTDEFVEVHETIEPSNESEETYYILDPVPYPPRMLYAVYNGNKIPFYKRAPKPSGDSGVFYDEAGNEIINPSSDVVADGGDGYYGEVAFGRFRYVQAGDPITGEAIYGWLDWLYYYDSANKKYVTLSISESEWEIGRSSSNPYVTAIKIDGAEGGKKLEIHGCADPQKFSTVGQFKDAMTGNPDFSDGYTGTAKDAINGCTLICEFDGRIFLSGNPHLPNSVFYTQRDLTGYNNPFYIGAYNYLNDGTGSTPITAMMATPTQLIVLKKDVAQGSSIYYHYAQDNPSDDKITVDLQPRIYPRENGIAGIGCTGLACNFRDDPVFLSPYGLEAIGKSAVNLERTVVHRSSMVDAKLINEDLSNARFAEWDGYLCILVPGGRMYLADSRQVYSHKTGGQQYEWYYWDDIGVYTGSHQRYVYLTDRYGAPEEVEVDGKTYPTAVISGDERFVEDGDIKECAVGETTYKYVLQEDESGQMCAYLVDATDEYTGGTFCEATELISVGGRLLFGCSDGTVCVFNTDKRGDNLAMEPESYVHLNRRYLSGFATKSDDLGRANLVKSTIKNSLVIASKGFPYSLVTVEVRTNAEPQHECDKVYAGEYDSAHTSFAALAFNPTNECIAVVREREKRWVEKQLFFYTECYESPFGVLSITYDYKVAGRYRDK